LVLPFGSDKRFVTTRFKSGFHADKPSEIGGKYSYVGGLEGGKELHLLILIWRVGAALFKAQITI